MANGVVGNGGGRAAAEGGGPLLATLYVPLILGTFMTTLAFVELGVDLSGDAALRRAWYTNAPTLPIVSGLQKACVMLVLLAVPAKTLLRAIPGAVRGTPGCRAACVPAFTLPLLIYTSLKALALISAPGGLDSEAVAAQVTTYHFHRALLAPFNLLSAVVEYDLRSHSARKQLKHKDT